jgi:hypothetical protein
VYGQIPPAVEHDDYIGLESIGKVQLTDSMRIRYLSGLEWVEIVLDVDWSTLLDRPCPEEGIWGRRSLDRHLTMC